MKRWIFAGTLFSVALGAVSLATAVIIRCDGFILFSLIGVALYLLVNRKEPLVTSNDLIFRANPETVAVLLIIARWVIAPVYYGSLYTLHSGPRNSFFWQTLFICGVRMFLYGFIIWYLAAKIKIVYRDEKLKFWKNSWIYRLFLYLDEKRAAYEEEIAHYDLRDDDTKRMKKFVIITGILIAIMCFCWFFGLILVVPYCFWLYGFLGKNISGERKNYAALYDMVSNVASGNLDIDENADLGFFGAMKPKVMLISEGIKTAVEEEVKSERMKMELVTNVSHDLKTPLTAMITYIDLLKEEKDEEKRNEYLDILSRRSERLKILIEDLFEVTKATTGNVKFEPVEMDIVNLLKQVILEYEERLKASGLEVVAEYPEEKAPVFADSQKTYRIYSNLLGNVAKYSMKNSRVYIKVEQTDAEVVTVIKNISAMRLNMEGKDLTERFVRGDSSRNTEGSGLGLAIAKSFTELQGGRFDIAVDGDLFKAVIAWKKM